MFLITKEWLEEYTKQEGYLSQQKVLLKVGKNDTPDKICKKVVDTLTEEDIKMIEALGSEEFSVEAMQERWKQ